MPFPLEAATAGASLLSTILRRKSQSKADKEKLRIAQENAAKAHADAVAEAAFKQREANLAEQKAADLRKIRANAGADLLGTTSSQARLTPELLNRLRAYGDMPAYAHEAPPVGSIESIPDPGAGKTWGLFADLAENAATTGGQQLQADAFTEAQRARQDELDKILASYRNNDASNFNSTLNVDRFQEDRIRRALMGGQGYQPKG
jgi:hypothetical protein